jgi:hypothetical protein
VPIVTEGVVQGCTLVYNHVALDHAYRKGEPVLGIGNFAVFGNDNVLGMSLKLGVVDVKPGQKPKAEAPNYACIKTPNGSTAGIAFQAVDAEKGARCLFTKSTISQWG